MRSLSLILNLLAAGVVSAAEPEAHWSLQPRTRPAVPDVRDAAFPIRTPVDAFILARLKQAGLAPAAEADRVTLIRRVTFDLTGLPPTPVEIDAFVKDTSPDAFEKLVERLLASPRYGEKWGRHWLDVVRYSESEGFEYDRHRAGAWRYRDYVIDAFNRDKPYNQFILEQLAGDEIAEERMKAEGGSMKPKGSRDQVHPSSLGVHPFDEMQIAAGFNRLGPVRRNMGNQELAFSRHEVMTEMADAAGTVFLGLTIACARCHDHKFDDISLDDYYSFQAFFAAAQEHDLVKASPFIRAAWKSRTARLQGEIRRLKKSASDLTGEARERIDARVKNLEASLPPPLPTISTVQNLESERTTVHVLKRGNTDRKGREVGPKLLEVGFAGEVAELPADTPKPRTILARAIVEPDHPLTARVMVNRIWQWHFGAGIVETANDFGINGSRPTHPELLDWLASEFVDGGWSIKKMHRLIVLSSTYRQASEVRNAEFGVRSAAKSSWIPHSALRIPDSMGFPRRRLTAEEVRDSMLAVSGTLNLKRGGPSIFVPVEKDLVNLLYAPSQWTITPDAKEHDRRSVYLVAKRNLRLPFMEAFDQPDAALSCSRRESSTHALQSLELLNGSLANRLADAFADRLRREAGSDAKTQVELAYRLAAGRLPTARERELAIEFLKTQPLREFALAMFNLNAFLYVN